jgi:hypothetical protein
MTVSIKATIRDKARQAARQGKSLDDNPFNWHAPAFTDWNIAFWQEQDVMRQEKKLERAA